FNAFALRPWSVRDPASVVVAHRFTAQGGGEFGIAEYGYLAQHSHALSGLIAMGNGEQVKLDSYTAGRQLQLTYVSGNYFRVLGVDMERGRGFLEEEDWNGAPQAVAVISYEHSRYGRQDRCHPPARSERLDPVAWGRTKVDVLSDLAFDARAS